MNNNYQQKRKLESYLKIPIPLFPSTLPSYPLQKSFLYPPKPLLIAIIGRF